jgi:hypothetical protein
MHLRKTYNSSGDQQKEKAFKFVFDYFNFKLKIKNIILKIII